MSLILHDSITRYFARLAKQSFGFFENRMSGYRCLILHDSVAELFIDDSLDGLAIVVDALVQTVDQRILKK